MEQINNHPLVEFVYRVFGSRLGGLLLAGYGEESTPEERTFQISEEIVGVSIEWEIEITGNAFPCKEEPLVLAALLKLLLKRPNLSYRLGFEMREIVTELGWEDSPQTQQSIDSIISNYVSLLYSKELRAESEAVAGLELRWGHYRLIAGYFRVTRRDAEGMPSSGTTNYVDFDPRFIEEMKIGQVYFADINFGSLSLENVDI